MSVLCTLTLALMAPTAPAADEAPLIVTKPYPIEDLTDGDDEACWKLAERVVGALDREAWATYGGPGSVRVVEPRGSFLSETKDSPSEPKKTLVVRQTQEHHQEVAVFLTKLRTSNNKD
ncbi:hypothetical protein [Alienimonas californiensis]|uniref:Uncharacterized protein n=1 Tax=Alienimonas californiensis TaxID=2527989 RepID=A0A517P3V4_9PLAN|nr:hypothetical protein [Alienimonas californiensis]QDT14033.1 hypothetical protein CA12_01010 [Alienimonas californiensis]